MAFQDEAGLSLGGLAYQPIVNAKHNLGGDKEQTADKRWGGENASHERHHMMWMTLVVQCVNNKRCGLSNANNDG